MRWLYNVKQYYKTLDTAKKLFWLYVILIFVEGTMRKWFMPKFADAWMVCREPIVFLLFIILINKGVEYKVYVRSFMYVGLFMFLYSITFGHGDLIVALYGFRIWFVHVPFIFIMSSYLDRMDLIYISRFFLLLAVLMTPLYIVQFYSPPNNIINANIGGDVLDSEEAAFGAVRASGVFGHVVGASHFNPIVVSLFVAGLWSKKYRNILMSNNLIFTLVTICVFATAISSVQRGAIFYSILVIFVPTIILILIKGRYYLFKSLITLGVGGILLFVIANIEYNNKTLLEPTLARFEGASETEGGAEGILESRILEPFRFWQEKGHYKEVPLFGYGIGAGSNFGTIKLGLGSAWGLGEWSSQIVTSEMGFFVGGFVFFLRIVLCIQLLFLSVKKLVNNKDIFPISLWTLSIFFFGNGNINMTTSLGLIVMHMILLLLSIRTSNLSVKYKEL